VNQQLVALFPQFRQLRMVETFSCCTGGFRRTVGRASLMLALTTFHILGTLRSQHFAVKHLSIHATDSFKVGKAIYQNPFIKRTIASQRPLNLHEVG
jgi:hypothetical protein